MDPLIPPKKEESNPLKNYAKYSTLFIQMAIIIIGGVAAGFWLDKTLKFSIPICTILLSLLSVGVSIYLTVKDFIKFK